MMWEDRLQRISGMTGEICLKLSGMTLRMCQGQVKR